jgi:sulfur relay (sulfurtransferase) DsrC/TusE family protein
MGYAFENTPYYLLPDSERLAIWIMQAAIRDNALTPEEWMVCAWAREDMQKMSTTPPKRSPVVQARAQGVRFNDEGVNTDKVEVMINRLTHHVFVSVTRTEGDRAILMQVELSRAEWERAVATLNTEGS